MNYTAIEIPYGDHSRAARRWAREQFGRAKGPDGNLKWHEMIWYSRHFQKTHNLEMEKFYFSKEDHAMFFALRWLK